MSLIELGRDQDALDFATAELASAQRLTDRVVEAPVLAALLLGKSATAHERGVRLEIDPGTSVGQVDVPSGDLVTIVGNLLDNAIDAALGARRRARCSSPPGSTGTAWSSGSRTAGPA